MRQNHAKSRTSGFIFGCIELSDNRHYLVIKSKDGGRQHQELGAHHEHPCGYVMILADK